MTSDGPGAFRRILVFVALVTAAAAFVFGHTLAADGFGVVDGLLTGVFAVLFGWITFWCTLTLLGALRVLRTRGVRATLSGGGASDPAEVAHTAILIPVHNEDVEGVMARIRAMLESLVQTGTAEAFDFYVLSDTTEPDIWLREELAWGNIRRAHPGAPHVYYRRRANKFRKKSGNITDFCEKWGYRYEYMIVLDADSIMDGKTMVEMVRRMTASPKLGILQAPSLPAMRDSLYARLQQFAASVYGPPIFAGMSGCFQGSATFWGHNAIVRVRAFMEHCGLPGLSGEPPFGGPILSHDFVEAALMRRAGYDVRLAWDLVAGSYEQCPVSLASSASRDRRWCQGNLQHLRLMFSPALTLESRAHFAVGILFYVASVLWGFFVVVFTVQSLRAATLSPTFGPAPLGVATTGLMLATLTLLFSGKTAAIALALSDEERRREHGGGVKLLASAALEMILAALTAPILMVSHVLCVASVLFGFSVDWAAANRDETASPWKDALRAHGIEGALGLVVLGGSAAFAPSVVFWLAPIWVSLLLAVPVGAILSSRVAGEALRRRRLFLSPTEVEPPQVIRRAAELMREDAGRARTFIERFETVIADPWLNMLHVSLVEATGIRLRPRRVIESLVHKVAEFGPVVLDRKETLAILSDAWAMRTLHEQSLLHAAMRDSPPGTMFPVISPADVLGSGSPESAGEARR
jgi:membrane glycosyltransferase